MCVSGGGQGLVFSTPGEEVCFSVVPTLTWDIAGVSLTVNYLADYKKRKKNPTHTYMLHTNKHIPSFFFSFHLKAKSKSIKTSLCMLRILTRSAKVATLCIAR